MKRVKLFFMIFVPLLLNAQMSESFTDGEFFENPAWIGSTVNFKVNADAQLQSSALVTSVSYLSTSCEAFVNASWECWVKINYTTSSSNFASVYIGSDNADISNGCNGYYVQIGGTNDEVSLFLQQGTKKTKIIDGTDKRIDGNPVELRIKVTRDVDGNFELFSKLSTESSFVSEGKVQNNVVQSCSYFGLLYSNTSTTGSAYFFDDIMVTGDKAQDFVAPVWESTTLISPNAILLTFNEKMDFSKTHFEIDNGVGEPSKIVLGLDKKSVELTFDRDFEYAILYTLNISYIYDLAGNELFKNSQYFGLPQAIASNDLVWNEVMFENATNGTEYVEVYNASDKVLDASQFVFCTRKTDGTLNTSIVIADKTLMAPRSYLAICPAADSLRSYFNIYNNANIVSSKSWSSLNNESATLVLCNEAKDTIFDEFSYSSKWHNVMIKNPKAVALEKMNPALSSSLAESWYSAASEVNYGTPGYQNSQFRELDNFQDAIKWVWCDPEAFSPDNDGNNDVCLIKYKTETDGYIANVSVFNAIGVKVLQLASNVLMASEGFFVWDGKTDKGINANTGVYVLYIEIFNPVTGVKKCQKLPIVLSSI